MGKKVLKNLESEAKERRDTLEGMPRAGQKKKKKQIKGVLAD